MFNENGLVLMLTTVKEPEKDGIYLAVEDALKQIKNGHVLIPKARKSSKEEYNYLKLNKLPCLIWNYSGRYAYFDFDFKEGNKEGNPILSPDQISSLKVKLFEFEWIVAVWDSLSHTGLGVLVYYNHQIESDQEWRDFYLSVIDEFRKYTGYSCDNKCVNINRKNVISYDPDLLIKDPVLPFPIELIQGHQGGVHSSTKIDRKLTYVTPKCTPSMPRNMQRFHRQSFIDVHFKELIDEAIYVNEEERYAVFPTRMIKIGLYTPKSKKFGSSRKVTLFYALIARYFLNPTYSHPKLYEWFREFNRQICSPPLSDEILASVWEFAIQRIHSENFYIKGNRDCFVHFFSSCELSLQEKRAVVSKSRVIRTKHAIKTAIKKLECEGLKIIKESVAELAGVKIRTVTKYWSEFLPVEMQEKIFEHKQKYYGKLPEKCFISGTAERILILEFEFEAVAA